MSTTEDLQLPAGFGTTSYSSQKYENWKLKPADDCIERRTIPPYGSLARTGELGLFWKLHFGWKGRNSSDPTKTNHKPFVCVEEKRGDMITVACPACQLRAEHEKRWEEAKSDMERRVNDAVTAAKAKGVPEPVINKEATKLRERLYKEAQPINDWLSAHGTDGKYRMICMDRQGTFGIFNMPYGLYKKTKAEMRKLHETKKYPGTETAVDPCGKKGVWFRYNRVGKASRDSDTPEVCRVQNAEGYEMLDFHVISVEQLMSCVACIPDLEQIRDQNRIRIDQIEALVELDRAGGGSSDPDEVDRILETGKNNHHTPAPTLATPPKASEQPREEVKAPEQPKAAEAIKSAVEAKVAEAKPADPTPPVAPLQTTNGATISDESLDDLFANA